MSISKFSPVGLAHRLAQAVRHVFHLDHPGSKPAMATDHIQVSRAARTSPIGAPTAGDLVHKVQAADTLEGKPAHEAPGTIHGTFENYTYLSDAQKQHLWQEAQGKFGKEVPPPPAGRFHQLEWSQDRHTWLTSNTAEDISVRIPNSGGTQGRTKLASNAVSSTGTMV